MHGVVSGVTHRISTRAARDPFGSHRFSGYGTGSRLALPRKGSSGNRAPDISDLDPKVFCIFKSMHSRLWVYDVR